MRYLITIVIAALTLNAFSQVPDYVPSDGLVGWWPFNGNALDESDYQNDGSVYGAIITSDRFGNENSAYSFNGFSNYIDCGPLNEISTTVGDLTQSAWILAPTDQSSYCKMSIMSKRQNESDGWPTIGGGANGTINFPVNNQAYFFLNSGGYAPGYYNTMSSTNFTNDNAWHLVTGTKSGNTYKLYFDGVLQATLTNDYPLSSNSHLIIGHEAHWGFECEKWYAGKIDDIGIWNRALTEVEIEALYTAEIPISGCADETACNFIQNATFDDGSCDYSCCPGPGCCDVGTVWNIESQTCIVLYPSDSNFDGCVDLDDLLDLLGTYGSCISELPDFAACGDDIEHEGYSYSTVQIGEQCWFAENCRYLPVVSPSSYSSTTDPDYYVYGYEGIDVAAAQATTNYETYGVLYNWPAVIAEGICPSGWHVPTDGEFTGLVEFLGGESVAGGKMKESGDDHWALPNTGATNSSGFNGLPGGSRYAGGFITNGEKGYWWSASVTSPGSSGSLRRRLDSNSSSISSGSYTRNYGFSARCIMD